MEGNHMQDEEKAERNAEICDLYANSDMTLDDIGAKFGISRQRVLQIAQRHKMQSRFAETLKVHEQMIKAVDAGYTVAEIADLFGCSESQVRMVAHTKGRAVNRYSIDRKEEVERILTAVGMTGLSISNLTKHDRRLRDHVYRTVKERGIELDHQATRRAKQRKLIQMIMASA